MLIIDYVPNCVLWPQLSDGSQSPMSNGGALGFVCKLLLSKTVSSNYLFRHYSIVRKRFALLRPMVAIRQYMYTVKLKHDTASLNLKSELEHTAYGN